jgi:collagenase-like PrtC family protease
MKINVRLPLTNDELAGWIRADFPDYKLEASVIKNIDNKENITLFANAGCAYTCPSKICNHSVSITLSSYAHVKPI